MGLPDLPGFFINLDRSDERRCSIEAALDRHGLSSVRRFAAIEGDDRPRGISRAELGCFLSHQAIIEAAAGDRPVLILEDDVVFPARFDGYFALAMAQAARVDWDILFLNQMISFTDLRSVYQLIQKKRQLGDIHAPDFDRFSIEPCKGLYVSSAAAYLVRPAAAPKIAAILRQAAEAGYPKAVDIVYMQAINAGRIEAKFVFPYIVGVNSRYESTLTDRAADANGPLFNDILNLFVAGGDMDHLLLRAHQAAHRVRFDPDAFVASQILYQRLAR